MLEALFPRIADNNYRGRRAGLWLFALMLLKVAMGVNVMANAPAVATSADGIPVSTFNDSGGAAFAFVFAAWGLGQLVLGLLCLVILLRYRALVPFGFLLLLAEQAGRMALRFRWPVERQPAPGTAINIVLTLIMVCGLILSLWRSAAPSAREAVP